MGLLEAFATLPRASKPGAFVVGDEASRCRPGRTFEGYPALLVTFLNENGAKIQRRLANLAYQPPVEVEIIGKASSSSTRVAIVECATAERRLVEYFFRISEQVLVPEATAGDEARFEAALDGVITLFKALQRPGTRTIQGLWTELAIIALASKPLVALSSWHSSPRALHDFSAGPLRVEAKSTTKRMREHAFSLDQLIFGQPGEVLVASTLLTELSSGSSVFDLVSLIRTRVGDAPEPVRRLETVVADSLGVSHEEVDDWRYDLAGAAALLRFYLAHEVPTCGLPLPPEVKDVAFTVDLSTTPSLSLEQARSIAPFFGDLLPNA